MLSWLTAAVYCEEVYGVQVDMYEGFFVCPEWDTCFMSVAWYHNDKLEHMNFLLNGIDHPWKYPMLYKRGWEQ